MTQTTKYALRVIKTGKLLGISESSNGDADFCNSTTVHLYADQNPTWYADEPREAEYVRNNSTPWYNSSVDTPNHDFKAEDLEVVRVQMTIAETPFPCKGLVPTWRQIYERKIRMNADAAKEYEYMLKEREKVGKADVPCDDHYSCLQFWNNWK